MKKIISVLLVLALAITSLVIVSPSTETQAATKKKLYPTIKAVNCKSNKKKVYVGKNIKDCLDNTYFESTAKKGLVKLTKIKPADNAYLEITAPEDGILFIQLAKTKNNGEYVLGTTSSYTVYDRKINDISDLNKIAVLAKGYLPTSEYRDSLNAVGSLARVDALCEYPMAKDEVLYLHLMCEDTASLKLAWIGNDNLVSIDKYGDCGKIEFIINTGAEVAGTSNGYFNYAPTTATSLKSYFSMKDENRCSAKGTKINKITNNKSVITVSANIESGISYGTACVVVFGFDVKMSDFKSIPVGIKIYYPNITQYNTIWLSQNSPSQPIFMEAKTNIVYGYDSTGKTIVLIYNKKTYEITPDENGFYYFTLKSKLSKNKVIEMYYKDLGPEVKSSYTVSANTSASSSASTKSFTATSPILCKKGTNIIIGKIDVSESTKVYVKVGKKIYTTSTTNYTETVKQFSGSPSAPAIKGTSINGLYCVVLSSNLKAKDVISIYPEGGEANAKTFNVQP